MNNIFGIHEQSLMLSSKRAQLIANNIANAETPGYLARDLDFKSVFNQSQTVQMSQTDAAHHVGLFDGEGFSGLSYRIPLQPAQDGNTVDVQMEKSAYLDNAMHFQATMRFLNGRIQGLLSAIKGE